MSRAVINEECFIRLPASLGHQSCHKSPFAQCTRAECLRILAKNIVCIKEISKAYSPQVRQDAAVAKANRDNEQLCARVYKRAKERSQTCDPLAASKIRNDLFRGHAGKDVWPIGNCMTLEAR